MTMIFILKPVHCIAKALDKNNGSGNNVHLWNFSSSNANQKWQSISVNGGGSPNYTAGEKDFEATPMLNQKKSR